MMSHMENNMKMLVDSRNWNNRQYYRIIEMKMMMMNRECLMMMMMRRNRMVKLMMMDTEKLQRIKIRFSRKMNWFHTICRWWFSLWSWISIRRWSIGFEFNSIRSTGWWFLSAKHRSIVYLFFCHFSTTNEIRRLFHH